MDTESKICSTEQLLAPSSVTLTQATIYWLKLGFISFGGPAGQIAIMHHDLVEKKRWISEKRFLHALNFCMVLPGPEAQQLATYIGWLMHRTWGGIIAGCLFVFLRFLFLWRWGLDLYGLWHGPCHSWRALRYQTRSGRYRSFCFVSNRVTGVEKYAALGNFVICLCGHFCLRRALSCDRTGSGINRIFWWAHLPQKFQSGWAWGRQNEFWPGYH